MIAERHIACESLRAAPEALKHWHLVLELIQPAIGVTGSVSAQSYMDVDAGRLGLVVAAEPTPPSAEVAAFWGNDSTGWVTGALSFEAKRKLSSLLAALYTVRPATTKMKATRAASFLGSLNLCVWIVADL